MKIGEGVPYNRYFQCDRKVKRTEHGAKREARKRGGKPWNAYKCPWCGDWHVGKLKGRGRPKMQQIFRINTYWGKGRKEQRCAHAQWHPVEQGACDCPCRCCPKRQKEHDP